MAAVAELSTESNSPAAQVPDETNARESPVKVEQAVEEKKPESKGTAVTEGTDLKEKTAKLDKKSTPTPTSEKKPRTRSCSLRVAKGIFRIVVCALGVLVVFLFFVSIGVGIAAANGAFIEVVGNIILRSGGKSGYTTDRIAAIVGSVGGIFAGLIVGALFPVVVPKISVNSSDVHEPHAVWIRLVAPVLTGTLTGAIGLPIMKKHIDLQGFDLLHAVRAGALGGTIITVAAAFIYPLIFSVLGLLLTPLWFAMLSVLEFILVSSERGFHADDLV